VNIAGWLATIHGNSIHLPVHPFHPFPSLSQDAEKLNSRSAAGASNQCKLNNQCSGTRYQFEALHKSSARASAAMAPHNVSSSLPQDDSLPIILDADDLSNLSSTLNENDSSGTTTPRNDTMKEIQVPKHPIPSMQGAFAESMLEASEASTPTAP